MLRLLDRVEDRDPAIVAMLLERVPSDDVARTLGISARALELRRKSILKDLGAARASAVFAGTIGAPIRLGPIELGPLPAGRGALAVPPAHPARMGSRRHWRSSQLRIAFPWTPEVAQRRQRTGTDRSPAVFLRRQQLEQQARD